MKVRVQLFAAAKELLGQDSVTVEVREPATLGDVRVAVEAAAPALARTIAHSLWALGAQYATEETPVTGECEVALIPPVSGG
ncbi:MAG: MoaD/ThiS family protein [Pirellulales bacterium]|nr:MoaD/ThiS family protein [Pirellulales bacterium]